MTSLPKFDLCLWWGSTRNGRKKSKLSPIELSVHAGWVTLYKQKFNPAWFLLMQVRETSNTTIGLGAGGGLKNGRNREREEKGGKV